VTGDFGSGKRGSVKNLRSRHISGGIKGVPRLEEMGLDYILKLGRHDALRTNRKTGKEDRIHQIVKPREGGEKVAMRGH